MNATMISTKIENPSHNSTMGFRVSMALMLIISLLIPVAKANPQQAAISTNIQFGKKVIEVDIVEIPTKFSFDETPVFEDGFPAYGGEFITQGIIYPKGTLELGAGVDAEGNPEFPDLVIGTWICRGWHVGDGARTVTGPSVVTHQLFNFGQKFGFKTITTDGVELADADVPIKRAITGGTGAFKRARGEQIQTFKGATEFETEQGPSASFRFRMKFKIQ